MTRWITKRFGEALDIRNGRNQREVESADGEYPILGSAGKIMGYTKEYICDAGTTIIGRKGTINSPIFSETRFWNVDTAFGLSPKEGLDGKFLYYFCQSYDFGTHNRGTTIPSLVKSDLLGIEIPLPPLEEQRRIVAVLDEAFAAIATASANAEKNLANARGLFEAQRERLLRAPVGEWQDSPLSNICTIKHGFAFKSEYFCGNARQTLLTPGNFFEAGGYRDRGAKQKYYDGPIPEGFVLRGGDLLVAMTEQAAGLLGSPILVPTSGIYLHNQRLGLVQPRPGVEWVNEFFFHVFNTSHLRDQLHRTGTGQKVHHTSPGKIGDVVVLFPATAAEQSAIARQLDELWSEAEQLCDVYVSQLEKLSLLKQSLLHEAFTGELTAAMPETIAA